MTENLCPLVTPYTEAIGAPLKTMELLARVRAHDPEEGPIPITLPETWRKTAKTSGKPLALRNFQTQMVAHLIKMPRFLNGDGVGLGKTASSIAATTFLKAKNPNLKILVFGTKSTTYQWKDEGFDEFTTLNTHVMEDSYKKLKGHEARIAQLKDFLEGEWDVLICKYTSFIGRRRTLEGDFDEHGHPIAPGQKEDLSQETRDLIETITPYGDDVILICDECHKFKSTTAQVRNMVMTLSKRIGRVWGMTATAIQNSLEDFYSIASAIGIRPFGGMMPFREKFCRYKMTYIGKGRQKPTLVGYKDVKEFKIGMRPFFYGRSQAQVKEKLPQLTTRYIPIDLNDQQIKLLDDIQKGKASLPPTIKKINGEFFQKERDITNKMTLMGIMQQISNHPCLLEDNPQSLFTKTLSAKEEELKELLEGELLGEKILVFTKSKKWIDRFEYLFEHGFSDRKFLRITGDENEVERARNKKLFQTSDEHSIMFINAAIMEGANLQQSANMILLDAPWGWGALIQLVGRMVRMGSPHSHNTLFVMVAKGMIDEYVIDTLKSKKGVFEKILGESHSSGLLDAGGDLDLASGMESLNDDKEFRELLTAHIKNTKILDYLKGDLLAEAQDAGEDYVMSFEKKAKPGIKPKKFEFSDKW